MRTAEISGVSEEVFRVWVDRKFLDQSVENALNTMCRRGASDRYVNDTLSWEFDFAAIDDLLDFLRLAGFDMVNH